MEHMMATKAEVLEGGQRRGIGGEVGAVLYQEHGPRLFRLAYWVLLGDCQAAAELVRGVFERCLAGAPAEDSAERLGHRLEAVGVRTLRDLAPASREASGTAGEELDIGALAPEPRLAFLLHDGVGYPLARCAELLNLPPEACRELLFAARLRLCRRGWEQAPAAA